MKQVLLLIFGLATITLSAQTLTFDTDTSEIDVAVSDPYMFYAEFPVGFTMTSGSTMSEEINYNFIDVTTSAGAMIDDGMFDIGTSSSVFYTSANPSGSFQANTVDSDMIPVIFNSFFLDPGIQCGTMSFTIAFTNQMNLPLDTITLIINACYDGSNLGSISFDADSAEVDVSILQNDPPMFYVEFPVGYTMTGSPLLLQNINYNFLDVTLSNGFIVEDAEFMIGAGQQVFYNPSTTGGSIMAEEINDIVVPTFFNSFTLGANELSGRASFTIEFTDSQNIPLDTVTLIVNVCYQDAQLDLIDFTTPVPFCPGSEVDFTAPDGFETYTWSSGDITQNATFAVGQDGFVSLDVSDGNGCFAMDMIIIDFDIPEPQPLCFVTVDDATGKNKLLWEKTPGTGIDMFNIYKQGVAVNQFDLVASQPFDDFSEFIDIDSNPFSQSERYRISATNGCGTESDALASHKTMHLTSGVGINDEVNLIWEPYDGLQYATFNIYRGSSMTSPVLIAQRPSNTFTYTDFEAPAGSIFYYIEIEAPNCDPSRAVSAIRSNFSEAEIVGTNELLQSGFNFFPNPVNDQLTLRAIPNCDHGFIQSISGRILKQFNVSQTSEKNINVADLPKGMYLIQFEGISGAVKFNKL